MRTRAWATIRRFTTAGLAQGVSSLGNLLIALLVARYLGPDGLGKFSFCFAIVLLLVSMQTSWVGDSLVVLDRKDPDVRRAIGTTQWLHCGVGLLIAPPIALLGARTDVKTSLVLGLLVVAWELEEFGRRTLMARLEFWKQGVNDSIFLVTSVTALVVAQRYVGMSLGLALGAMTLGATAAFVAGQLSLPDCDRLQYPSRTRVGLNSVAAFGVWRAAQAGSGYLVQLGSRYLIIAVTSIGALGNLEAARLAVAPLFTLLAASSNVLLPTLAAARSEGRTAVSRTVGRATFLLSVACVLYGMLVLLFPSQVTRALAGDSFSGDRLAVGGWLTLALMLAISGPVGAAALVVIPSSLIFWVRIVGSIIGLALSIPMLIHFGAGGAPYGTALGMLAIGLLLASQVSKPSHWTDDSMARR